MAEQSQKSIRLKGQFHPTDKARIIIRKARETLRKRTPNSIKSIIVVINKKTIIKRDASEQDEK